MAGQQEQGLQAAESIQAAQSMCVVLHQQACQHRHLPTIAECWRWRADHQVLQDHSQRVLEGAKAAWSTDNGALSARKRQSSDGLDQFCPDEGREA